MPGSSWWWPGEAEASTLEGRPSAWMFWHTHGGAWHRGAALTRALALCPRHTLQTACLCDHRPLVKRKRTLPAGQRKRLRYQDIPTRLDVLPDAAEFDGALMQVKGSCVALSKDMGVAVGHACASAWQH